MWACERTSRGRKYLDFYERSEIKSLVTCDQFSPFPPYILIATNIDSDNPPTIYNVEYFFIWKIIKL